MADAAQQLVNRLEELAAVTDVPGELTRTFLSPAMRRANKLVGGWMREAGLNVRIDTVGNLIGRLEPPAGTRTSRRSPQTLLVGSHLDTVRNAGRFDGALGVLAPLAALTELKQRGVTLPFAVEVLGFSEEEGVRFASAYLGSKGYTGQLRARDLTLRDAHGASIADVLTEYNSGTGRAGTPSRPRRGAESAPYPVDPRPRRGAESAPYRSGSPATASAASPRWQLPKPAHSRRDLLGYCEVHIEQGPILEAEQLSVGVVSAIAGQTRGRLSFQGKAGHAGTTPMGMRRDALAGAADFLLRAERFARGKPPLVATVGTLAVPGGAPNVIPGEVILSLDVRHPRDSVRIAAVARLLRDAQAIAASRHLTCRWHQTQDNPAVACSRELTGVLEQSVRALQRRSLSLVSGAGHDAVVLSALTPVAMLFVRCREGLSHHPAEYAAPRDLRVAVQVLTEFLQRLAASHE